MRDLSMDALRRRREQLASPVEPPAPIERPGTPHVAEDDRPKAEAPTRGRESDVNGPERFDALPIHEKINLRAWVRENVVPQDELLSSYALKHTAEHDIGGRGYYVGNGEMRGAMLEAGHVPVEIHGPNAYYKAGPKDKE
jgi:hypothetical protein